MSDAAPERDARAPPMRSASAPPEWSAERATETVPEPAPASIPPVYVTLRCRGTYLPCPQASRKSIIRTIRNTHHTHITPGRDQPSPGNHPTTKTVRTTNPTCNNTNPHATRTRATPHPRRYEPHPLIPPRHAAAREGEVVAEASRWTPPPTPPHGGMPGLACTWLLDLAGSRGDSTWDRWRTFLTVSDESVIGRRLPHHPYAVGLVSRSARAGKQLSAFGRVRGPMVGQ